MSDKGLLFKKRKNNHGSHHKCSKGSGFPRHSMNHYPGTNMYAKYWTDTHNIRKPKEYKEGYYYSSYPQRWDRKGYCDRFSDMFRPGDSAFKWAQGIENGWVVPIIPFSKRSEWYGQKIRL